MTVCACCTYVNGYLTDKVVLCTEKTCLRLTKAQFEQYNCNTKVRCVEREIALRVAKVPLQHTQYRNTTPYIVQEASYDPSLWFIQFYIKACVRKNTDGFYAEVTENIFFFLYFKTILLNICRFNRRHFTIFR